VFWPGGFVPAQPLQGLDVASVAIFALATVALFRFGAGVIPVVLAGAVVGLGRALAL
jgi:chromate transporter